jgi:hypothetical protein
VTLVYCEHEGDVLCANHYGHLVAAKESIIIMSAKMAWPKNAYVAFSYGNAKER